MELSPKLQKLVDLSTKIIEEGYEIKFSVTSQNNNFNDFTPIFNRVSQLRNNLKNIILYKNLSTDDSIKYLECVLADILELKGLIFVNEDLNQLQSIIIDLEAKKK